MFKTPFKNRSRKKEKLDKGPLDKNELIRNLREFEKINRWFGTRSTLLSAFNKIYKKNTGIFNRKLRIADLGCGAGDALQTIQNWAGSKAISCTLHGIDKNKDIVQYARKNIRQLSGIQLKRQDIFSSAFLKQKYDIVCLSNICHHFSAKELKNLFRRLISQTQHAIIVNDLHRHFLPYFTIKILSKISRLSSLACHDGPLSVLKAFQKKDLIHILSMVKNHSYDIRWRWPFRWLVIIELKHPRMKK